MTPVSQTRPPIPPAGRRHHRETRRSSILTLVISSTHPVTAVVLAHQGGWDEILLVAGPLVVFAGLLWVAKKRAEKLVAAREAAERDPRGG